MKNRQSNLVRRQTKLSPTRLVKNEYVPKFIRDMDREQRNMRKSIEKYKWQAEEETDILRQYLAHLNDKYDGDKLKVAEEVTRLKKDGTLD